jgi:hypothetical protein
MIKMLNENPEKRSSLFGCCRATQTKKKVTQNFNHEQSTKRNKENLIKMFFELQQDECFHHITSTQHYQQENCKKMDSEESDVR